LDAFHLVKGEGPPGEGKVIVVDRSIQKEFGVFGCIPPGKRRGATR
jgi:hypothetical protein